MISKWVITLFLAFTICEFCGKDFKEVNGRKWRCKSRSRQSSSNNHVANDNASSSNMVNPEIINNRSIANGEYIHCSCGKKCEGLRGLKAHQRSCRVIKSMGDNFVDYLNNDYNELNDDNNIDINVENNLIDDNMNESPSLRNGAKLPTSINDWDIVKKYFHSTLPTSEISEKDIEETVEHLNETVYKYFKDNFGLVDTAKEDERKFVEMYKNFSKCQLKSELKRLKNERNPPISQLRFVSRKLRVQATSSPTNKVCYIDHDLELKNNFWSCIKHCLEKPTKNYPHSTNPPATSSSKKLLVVLTQIKDFEFHLGYHLFHLL